MLLLLPYVAAAGIPEGYYDAANGKKKADLKAAMHNIIQPQKLLSYGDGTWTGFYTTDRLPDNQVIDRYSNEKHYFPTSASAQSASAVSGMNIEHSFAKSWWGGSKNNAYKDLFNLMPSEQKANSAKSNYAMGRVTSNITYDNGSIKVGKGTTKQGTTKQLWEPADEWKGDFARDYFYMVTAYSNLTWTSNGLDMLENNDYPTMQQWAYTLLLQWARQDPVDENERRRNDAVYDIQKNRNPFVDFPNLAEYIWGDSVNFAFNVSSTSSGSGNTEDDDENPEFAVLLDCSLKSGFAPFFVRTYDGCEGAVWASDKTYGAKANAYGLPDKEADEYLMVSVDLTHALTATLSFQHATGYNKAQNVGDTYFQVLVSTDYNSVPEDATWHSLNATFPSPPQSSFTSFVSSGDISLNDYGGQAITLAFRYRSDMNGTYCWEVKDVKITAQTVADALPPIAADDATGTEPDDDKCYDLTGRMVRSDAKGLIIRNGKLILRK